MKFLLLSFYLFLVGCRVGYETGNYTIKTFGNQPTTIETSEIKLTDEDNRIDYIDSSGKKQTIKGSFELYEKN